MNTGTSNEQSKVEGFWRINYSVMDANRYAANHSIVVRAHNPEQYFSELLERLRRHDTGTPRVVAVVETFLVAWDDLQQQYVRVG